MNFKFSILDITKLIVLFMLPVLLSGCVGFGVGGGSKGPQDQFLKGRLVSGFPAVPIYPKVKLDQSYSGQGGFGAAFISSDNINKVVKFYNENLSKAGWQGNLRTLSDANYVFEIKNTKYKGSVIVNLAADGRKTAITISVEEKDKAN